MKKITILFTAAFVIFCLVLSGCVDVDKQLRDVVLEANTTRYPAKIDEETMLDSLSVSPGRNLYYHYTLLTLTKDDFTPEMLTTMELGLRANMINIIRSDVQEIKVYRDARVIFHHEYKDRNGNTIVSIVLTPEDYSD